MPALVFAALPLLCLMPHSYKENKEIRIKAVGVKSRRLLFTRRVVGGC